MKKPQNCTEKFLRSCTCGLPKYCTCQKPRQHEEKKHEMTKCWEMSKRMLQQSRPDQPLFNFGLQRSAGKMRVWKVP